MLFMEAASIERRQIVVHPEVVFPIVSGDCRFPSNPVQHGIRRIVLESTIDQLKREPLE
jgi:hypothetical protein